MTTLQHPTVTSDTYVQSLLRQQFAQRFARLDTAELVQQLAFMIQGHPSKGVKVVLLVGGAGSGKTTLTRRLVTALRAGGIKADSICTDDYTRGDRAWRQRQFEGEQLRHPHGKYDFDFMNRTIAAIRSNRDAKRVIKVPTYDPASGLAIDMGEKHYTHAISLNDVLLVEGDMSEVTQPDLTIYLHVPDEIRLQKRVERDLAERSYAHPQAIVDSFNLRHTNQHLPFTLPAADQANIIIMGDILGKIWYYDLFERAVRAVGLSG